MILRKEQLLSRLHFFIFGATIVGETVVTSLIVSELGSGFLGNLYFLNGLFLLLLPLLFFSKIDIVNRGILLKKVTRIAPIVIVALFVAYFGGNSLFPDHGKYFLLLFYPVSYLLKTVLFLTFWIMAADISNPSETKSLFPRVASSGFVGGMSGALVSWVLLNFISAELLILFWGFLYVVAYLSVNRIIDVYNDQLIPNEVIASSSKKRFGNLFRSTKEVLENVLVRDIAILYFGIFISIFLVDFHFWQQCEEIFNGTEKLSQFQYGFYVFHSLITILLLRYLTPDLIATRGFTKIFSYLPYTLAIGAVLFLVVTIGGVSPKVTVAILMLWQLFRYISFENFFSPIYQMFFAAVEKERRGRAKTVIEGLVKPLAIMTASIILMVIGKNGTLVVVAVGIISILLVIETLKIKHAYMRSLVEGGRSHSDDETNRLIADIGSDSEKECISILNEFASFSSNDMKRLAIKLLVRMDRPESNSSINELIINGDENHRLAREVARYAGEIKHNDELCTYLVQHEDSRVWHRAVRSLITHQTHLSEYREFLKRYFYYGVDEDRLYAGVYMCQNAGEADIPNFRIFLQMLIGSEKSKEIEYGVIGYVMLTLDNWEDIIFSNFEILSSETVQWAIRAVIKKSKNPEQVRMIETVRKFGHSEILFREIYKYPNLMVAASEKYVTGQMKYNKFTRRLIRSLGRLQLCEFRSETYNVDGIVHYGENLINDVYIVAASFGKFLKETPNYRKTGIGELLEITLKEKLISVAEIALDCLALTDQTGLIAEGRKELRIEEEQERVGLIELIEASRDTVLKDMVIPILEDSNWDVYHTLSELSVDKELQLREILLYNDEFTVTVALAWLNEMGEKFISAYDLRSVINSFTSSKNHHILELVTNRETEENEKMAHLPGTIEILDRVLFLKKSDLFSTVSAARLMRLADGIEEVKYREGDLISREGDRANHLYLMREGSAVVTSKRSNEAVKYADLHSGDAYGEVGLFNQNIRNASVIATTQCTVFVISRSYLKKMVSQIPELAHSFLKVFGKKLQASHDELIRVQTENNSDA